MITLNLAQLLEVFDATVVEARKLMQSKNADYSGGADALFNIRRGGQYGVAVRIDDKVSRLLTLLREQREPNHEGIGDTLLDLINYSVLLQALRTEDMLRKREAINSGGPNVAAASPPLPEIFPRRPFLPEGEKGTGK